MLVAGEGVTEHGFYWDPAVTAELHRAHTTGHALKANLNAGLAPSYDLQSADPVSALRKEQIQQPVVPPKTTLPTTQQEPILEGTQSEIPVQLAEEDPTPSGKPQSTPESQVSVVAV